MSELRERDFRITDVESPSHAIPICLRCFWNDRDCIHISQRYSPNINFHCKYSEIMNRSKILAGIADCTNSAEVNFLNSLQSFLWLCKRTTGSFICETSYFVTSYFVICRFSVFLT